MHLPVTVKEIKAGYFISPYFKDLHLYLAQNELPSPKIAIYKVETPVEKYILLDSLLFKLVTTPEKEMALLAKLEICTDKIITLYHSSLFAGHQCVINTYLTTGDKFIIPGLIHYLGISYYILRDIIFVSYLGMTNHLLDNCRLELIYITGPNPD